MKQPHKSVTCSQSSMKYIKLRGGSIQDHVVRVTMQTKYPARSRDNPATVHRGTARGFLPCLRDVLLGLEPGKSGHFEDMMNEPV